ncbi:hypothetical protein AWC38_SpisGene25240, partial [Stylophora pistillata]
MTQEAFASEDKRERMRELCAEVRAGTGPYYYTVEGEDGDEVRVCGGESHFSKRSNFTYTNFEDRIDRREILVLIPNSEGPCYNSEALNKTIDNGGNQAHPFLAAFEDLFASVESLKNLRKRFCSEGDDWSKRYFLRLMYDQSQILMRGERLSKKDFETVKDRVLKGLHNVIAGPQAHLIDEVENYIEKAVLPLGVEENNENLKSLRASILFMRELQEMVENVFGEIKIIDDEARRIGDRICDLGGYAATLATFDEQLFEGRDHFRLGLIKHLYQYSQVLDKNREKLGNTCKVLSRSISLRKAMGCEESKILLNSLKEKEDQYLALQEKMKDFLKKKGKAYSEICAHILDDPFFEEVGRVFLQSVPEESDFWDFYGVQLEQRQDELDKFFVDAGVFNEFPEIQEQRQIEIELVAVEPYEPVDEHEGEMIALA